MKVYFFLSIWFFSMLFADVDLCDCESCIYIRSPQTCTTPCTSEPKLSCGYNAPKTSHIACSFKAFVGGSYIYLQPIEENMQLALKTTTSSSTQLCNTIEGFDASFKSGFEVFGGFHFTHDGWDLTAKYLKYDNTFYKKIFEIQDLGLVPYFYETNPPVSIEASEIDSTWELDINLINGDFGREYYVGKYLYFRTHAGVEGGWIDQKLLIDTIVKDPSTTITYDSYSHNWFLGPSLGIQTEWESSCFLRLIADAAASILWTEYCTDYSMPLIQSSNDTIEIKTHLNDDRFLTPHLSFRFGAGWGNTVHCNDWFFDLQVAYRADVFFSQNPFARPVNNTLNFPNGNLYLHGLVISAVMQF